jgi:hypothetical protein
MSTDEPIETYQDRINKQMRKEIEEADTDWVRAQRHLDYLWQTKLDAESDWDDGYIEIGGFRERRTRYGFTKHWRDPDFDVH